MQSVSICVARALLSSSDKQQQQGEDTHTQTHIHTWSGSRHLAESSHALPLQLSPAALPTLYLTLNPIARSLSLSLSLSLFRAVINHQHNAPLKCFLKLFALLLCHTHAHTHTRATPIDDKLTMQTPTFQSSGSSSRLSTAAKTKVI